MDDQNISIHSINFFEEILKFYYIIYTIKIYIYFLFWKTKLIEEETGTGHVDNEKGNISLDDFTNGRRKNWSIYK